MNDVLKLKKIIEQADAVIVGAGAGLSAAAGIPYGEKEFKKIFPELVKRYGMTDMYTSSFFSFAREEERWSYWAKHIDFLYNIEAKKVYIDLFHLLQKKNYFVITTNVDGQFLKAGFDPGRVFEVQGSLSKIQCAVACHKKLYDDKEMITHMLAFEKDCKIPTELVPICSVCKGKMEVNLRKDSFFVEDDHWHKLNQTYENFIHTYKEKRLVFLELGVGFHTPGIIRFPFEQMTHDFKDATLIRVNERERTLILDIQKKTFLVQEDCASFLEKLKEKK